MNYNFNKSDFENLEQLPEKIAVVGSDYDLTWKEFKSETEKIITLFERIKLPENYPVIIYGHKEALFPAIIVACINMKIPYVPVDTHLPKERLKKIAQICNSKLIICLNENRCDDDFSIVIDKSLNVVKHEPTVFKHATLRYDETPAYILFTSGTTGEPKGVVVSQSAVKSYINWAQRIFNLSCTDVFVNQASYSFDISLFDTLLALHTGGTLVLNSAEISKNSELFINRIKKYKPTVWNSTPSFALLQLPNDGFTYSELLPLQKFILCGEELTAKLVNKIQDRFPAAAIINAYGPTEATVVTTHVTITKSIIQKYSKNLPIGYPKDDGKILVHNAVNDVEQEGELIIVGDHVALGYINNDKQTEEKFFTHEGKRAYRTGDFGFYKNNLLFFNGRNDDQVKLNGYRIELNEINDCIEKHPSVAASVTLPLKAGNVVKKIVSFIKLKYNNSDAYELKPLLTEHIKCSLPDYMVPGDYLFVNEFPVSNSFKVDKAKLIELYLNM